MKRTGFKPRTAPLAARRTTQAAVLLGPDVWTKPLTPPKPRRPIAKYRKTGKHRSAAMKRYMTSVAALGCVACIQDGFNTKPELHHPRAGTGGGMKAPDEQVIQLCSAHHRGTNHPFTSSIHLDKDRFIARYGDEAALLAWVRERVPLP